MKVHTLYNIESELNLKELFIYEKRKNKRIFIK